MDPSPAAARMLQIQAKLNGLGERLTVVTASASDHTGTEAMVATGVLSGGYFMRAIEGYSRSEVP